MNTEQERPRWRTTLNYRLLNRLQVGVEYNPAASEISPLFSLFLFTETDIRPALFLGTSSDRIGSPEDTQAYFVTASKRLPYLPLSVYGTVNYSEWDAINDSEWYKRFNFPFGASVDFGKGFSARGMYDGKEPHLMFNYFYKQHGISLMYIWLETFGIAMSTAF